MPFAKKQFPSSEGCSGCSGTTALKPKDGTTVVTAIDADAVDAAVTVAVARMRLRGGTAVRKLG